MNTHYTNILKSCMKNVLKGCMLFVHYFTRTPLIILYYLLVSIGLFGPKNSFTSFCFTTALFLIMTNVLLVLIYNWSFTKEWSTELVGKPFCDKYMSHSAPASKSLMRLGTGIAVPAVLEMSTSWQNHFQHTKITTELRTDINTYYGINDIRGMRDSQQVLNKVISDYRPGGLVRDTLRSEEARSFYNNVSEVGQTAIRSAASIFKSK